MLFFKAVASFAAMAACIMPVLSAPVAEANTDVSSVIVKRGALNDPAQTCYHEVQKKCDDIDGKINAVVEIDAKLGAILVVDLEVILGLLLGLGDTLKVVIGGGGLNPDDIKACVATVILIVKLCGAILIRIAAKLAATVSVSIFAAVVLKLHACIVVIINLLIGVCPLYGLLALVVDLTACLTAFVGVCTSIGINV